MVGELQYRCPGCNEPFLYPEPEHGETIQDPESLVYWHFD